MMRVPSISRSARTPLSSISVSFGPCASGVSCGTPAHLGAVFEHEVEAEARKACRVDRFPQDGDEVVAPVLTHVPSSVSWRASTSVCTEPNTDSAPASVSSASLKPPVSTP